jgi:hypothetical protein
MPNYILYTTLAAVAVAALGFVFFPLARAWWRNRGTRLITCPDNHEPAAVEIDALDAAFSAMLGETHHLKSCTRWPEMADCGQECLAQIEQAPDGCRVRDLLHDWYRGQSCVLCSKPLDEIHSWQHKPALMSPERVTYEWVNIPPEELPLRLSTHLPVCWDCHIIEGLYRKYPDLVVERDRPARHSARVH